MTPEEAHEHLAAIRRVIDRSKAERARSGDVYVVWGVVLVAADVLHLALDAQGIQWGWIGWPLASVIGTIHSIVVGRSRGQRVRTFGARIEGTLWMSMGLAMGILILGGISAGIMPPELVAPLIGSMVGVAMVTSSALFDSTLMRACGAMFLAIAVCSLFFSWQVQYALFGVGLVFGYIAPGLWWMREERRARDG